MLVVRRTFCQTASLKTVAASSEQGMEKMAL